MCIYSIPSQSFSTLNYPPVAFTQTVMLPRFQLVLLVLVALCGLCGSVVSATDESVGDLYPSCGQGESEWGLSCKRCDSVQWSFIATLIVFELCLIFALHRLVQYLDTFVLVLFFQIQTALFLIGSFLTEQRLYVLELFNLNFVSFIGSVCLGPATPEEKLLLDTLAPAAPFFALLFIVLSHTLIVVIWRLWIWVREKSSRPGGSLKTVASSPNVPSGEKHQEVPTVQIMPYIRTKFFLFFVTFQPVIRVALENFTCDEDSNTLRSRRNTQCNGETFQLSRSFATAWLALYFISMVVFVMLPFTLLNRWGRLRKGASTILPFFASAYRPGYWFWVIPLVLSHTLLAILGVVFVEHRNEYVIFLSLFYFIGFIFTYLVLSNSLFFFFFF